MPSAKKQECMKVDVILRCCPYFEVFGNIVKNYVLNSRLPFNHGLHSKEVEEIDPFLSCALINFENYFPQTKRT